MLFNQILLRLILLLSLFTLSCGEQELDKNKKQTTGVELPVEEPKTDDPDEGDDGDEPQGVVDLTYFSDTKSIIDNHCVSCHGSTPAAGAPEDLVLSIFDDAGNYRGVLSSVNQILGSLLAGTMPPAGAEPTLAEPDREKLVAWIEAGAAKGTPPESKTDPDPVLSFVDPAGAYVKVNESLAVEVSLLNVPDGSTWDLFYSTEPNVVTGGIVIAENLPAVGVSAQKMVNWNTSSIDRGIYYLYGIIRTETGFFPAFSSTKVEVDRFPIMALSTFNGGQFFLNSGTMSAITWTVEQQQGYDLKYKIEYSKDDGLSYTTIPGAEAITELSFSGWDISATGVYTQGAGYKVKVSAVDYSVTNPVVVSSVESQSAFGISSVDVTYYDDIYPIFLADGCGNCHGDGQVNVDKFAVDHFLQNGIGAFQLQQVLSSDAVLGTAGSMPSDDPGSFSPNDHTLVKLWEWGGAKQGTPAPSVNLVTHRGNKGYRQSDMSTIISWYIYRGNIPADTVLDYKVELLSYLTDPATVTVLSASQTASSFAWDISAQGEDHRYKIRVTAFDGGTEVARTESPDLFAIIAVDRSYTVNVLPTLELPGSTDCRPCHGGGTPSGDYALNDFTTLKADRLVVVTAPGSGTMPSQGGLSLTGWKEIRLWDLGGRLEPVVSLASHDGDELFVQNAATTVSWTVANAGSLDLRYDLAYTDDDGGSWTDIATGVDALSYDWDTTGIPINYSYKVRVKVYTNAKPDLVHSVATSTDEFAISDKVYTYVTDVLPRLRNGDLGCESCHNSANPGGNYDIEDAGTLSNPGVLATITLPGKGSMPAAGGLSSEDWKEIRIWDLGGNN